VIVSEVGAPFLDRARAVAVQFRYAFVCDAQGLKVVDITWPDKPRAVAGNTIPLASAHDVYLARTYAYVAAGKDGLVIVDAVDPERLRLYSSFNAGGLINDARGVRVASTNASVFAYVADGRNGLRVIQLTSPETPGHLGFSPAPMPRLIATRHTHGVALAVSRGLDRDRAVDEDGHQVAVFGRLGSRPFTLEEQRRFYLRDGRLWTVRDDGTVNMPSSSGGGGAAP
jgi:hypothetical protein